MFIAVVTAMMLLTESESECKSESERLPVKGLVILKELPERLKEEPELWPLNIVITVRIVTLGHILSSKNEITHF